MNGKIYHDFRGLARDLVCPVCKDGGPAERV